MLYTNFIFSPHFNCDITASPCRAHLHYINEYILFSGFVGIHVQDTGLSFQH